MTAPRPYNLVAELTYRCPLRCGYCSNPIDYAAHRETLSAEDWSRIFQEAAELGVLHVGLTGGEPSTRRDLEDIVGAAEAAGLYSLLVTAGLPLTPDGLARLRDAGLRSVQLSFQAADAASSDRIAGTPSFAAKLRLARAARELGLPLVLNTVLHRENLEAVPGIVALARELDAERLELANVQFHGWARLNRAGLLPDAEQLDRAAAVVARERRTSKRPELIFVLPDHWSDRPKPCMGGWGRKTMVVAPDGLVMPCHEARSLPDIELWNAAGHSLAECWSDAPGMNAYRGESWMPAPCRSCEQRGRDFGGCRCQSFDLLGDAAQTDPACELAPGRPALVAAREAALSADVRWRYRGEVED